MRILDRAVYVGPSLYAHFPVIRLELDLGALEDWPTAQARAARSSTRLLAALPGLARARLLLRRARRLHPPAARGRRHLARPHPRARGDRAAERRRRAGDLRQDARRRRARGTTTSSTSTSRRTSGSRPAGSALTPAALAAARRAPARGRGARRTSTSPAERGRVHPLRPAPRARARAPRRWCARPRSATSPGSGSTSRA